ncbi:MAG: alkylation response protein AidB-like acyl-CoA dehydrogenase [Chitinophagales bacterium]|jgi:alkylation response protein AidB-like acyl-CoA dehydrogenase
MTDYKAPVQDMLFTMKHLAGLDQVAALPGYEEASEDLVTAIVEEAARFTGQVLAPINAIGDQQGSKIEGDGVVTPAGFKEAYQQYVDGGWSSLAGDPQYGGQGLPELVAAPLGEMVAAANMSFSLAPLLSAGALNALMSHASDDLLAIYAEKMTSGEWTGSMNLTEPQAGSDLSLVRSKAIPNGDHYLISGQKIYITWGDHDMAENIIHLVLARLPDAPEGTRGISLFVVPKFLVNSDGTLGERNDAFAVSLEHKLGIHASATCTMSFGDNGGAVGYLVGQENTGLAHMFTMMNHARIGVGGQGLSISDRAYQDAVWYAKDRVQGGGKTIINHPDVRRMLMVMRASIEAMRALLYSTYAHTDNAHKNPDEEVAKASSIRADLMTPIVKGWCTEMSNELTSLGIQVHGGMGFVEETGVAQHYRDSRILAIYEGTNGIQAMDLIGRKLTRDGGSGYQALIKEMEETLVAVKAEGATLNAIATRLAAGIATIKQAVAWALDDKDSDELNSASFNLLMLTGYICGGWHMARAAVAANQVIAAGETDSFYRNKIITAGFYADHLMPRATGHLEILLAGSANVMDLAEGDF